MPGFKEYIMLFDKAFEECVPSNVKAQVILYTPEWHSQHI